MISIRRALILGALASVAGLVGAQPARAQFTRSSPFVRLLSQGGSTTATSPTPAITTNATSGPLGRPPASPITPSGPQLGP